MFSTSKGLGISCNNCDMETLHIALFWVIFCRKSTVNVAKDGPLQILNQHSEAFFTSKQTFALEIKFICAFGGTSPQYYLVVCVLMFIIPNQLVLPVIHGHRPLVRYANKTSLQNSKPHWHYCSKPKGIIPINTLCLLEKEK